MQEARDGEADGSAWEFLPGNLTDLPASPQLLFALRTMGVCPQDLVLLALGNE